MSASFSEVTFVTVFNKIFSLNHHSLERVFVNVPLDDSKMAMLDNYLHSDDIIFYSDFYSSGSLSGKILTHRSEVLASPLHGIPRNQLSIVSPSTIFDITKFYVGRLYHNHIGKMAIGYDSVSSNMYFYIIANDGRKYCTYLTTDNELIDESKFFHFIGTMANMSSCHANLKN